MFIHLTSLLVFFYLLFRLVIPLPVGLKWKAALGAGLLLVSQQHVFSRYVFGGLSSPELPSWLLLAQGWCFIALVLLFALTLGRDVFLLARALVRRLTRPERSSGPGGFSPERRLALFAIAAAVPAAYGVRQAVVVPGVREVTARLPRLPAELDGLVLAQISDLHVSPLLRRDWVGAVVERVNDLKPDIVVLTGDIVDGLPARRASSIAPLAGLRARYGVFGCAGNHEYYSDYRSWMRAFPDLGLTMLLNSHQTLTINGGRLVLAGVTDMVAERFSLPLPDTAAALAGAPEDALRILLDHRPGGLPENARHGVDLQLSGHTHGGQILGMKELVARFNAGFLHGWYREGGTRMYVSSGAGLWNGFPVRLGVPSEIVRLELKRA